MSRTGPTQADLNKLIWNWRNLTHDMIYQKSIFGEKIVSTDHTFWNLNVTLLCSLKLRIKKTILRIFIDLWKSIFLSPFTTSSDQNLVFSEVMIRTFNFAPNSEFDETFKIYKNNIWNVIENVWSKLLPEHRFENIWNVQSENS